MPVWSNQGSLQRAGQEHRPTDNSVCPEQLVDGQEADYLRDHGMSASAEQEKGTASRLICSEFRWNRIDSMNNCLVAISRF